MALRCSGRRPFVLHLCANGCVPHSKKLPSIEAPTSFIQVVGIGDTRVFATKHCPKRRRWRFVAELLSLLLELVGSRCAALPRAAHREAIAYAATRSCKDSRRASPCCARAGVAKTIHSNSNVEHSNSNPVNLRSLSCTTRQRSPRGSFNFEQPHLVTRCEISSAGLKLGVHCAQADKHRSRNKLLSSQRPFNDRKTQTRNCDVGRHHPARGRARGSNKEPPEGANPGRHKRWINETSRRSGC